MLLPKRRYQLSPLFLLVLAVVLPAGQNARASAPQQGGQPTAQPSGLPTSKPILLTDAVPDPHQPDVQYFQPTGHTLRGSFLSYWQQHGGLAQFGYPLTEEFTEPIGPNNSPIQVQYFERNRFEHHPENAGTQYEVLLGTLGKAFHAQDPPAQPATGATFFSETGHNLSGTFKAYWEAHGGLAIHGYPITEQFQEQSPTDGKTYTVQYFERTRMELHPENAGSPYEVLLGQLGVQLSKKQGFPYGWYPLFGHAADYSWVSGRLVEYEPGELVGNGCILFSYVGKQSLDAQLTNVRRIPATLFTEFISGKPSIVFGHVAAGDEPREKCITVPNALEYIVQSAQLNTMEPRAILGW